MSSPLDRIEARCFRAAAAAAADPHNLPGDRPGVVLPVADVLALVNVAKAAEQRPCNRFDVTPCSQRPEIDEADWCAMCEALAALNKAGGE